MFARLRWSAFGLRGRIVGAVLVTTAVTLGVAALVLLPQLENALREASKTALAKEVVLARKNGDLKSLQSVKYSFVLPGLEQSLDPSVKALANEQLGMLSSAEKALKPRLGDASYITLIGSIDARGVGHPYFPTQSPADNAADSVVNLSSLSGEIALSHRLSKSEVTFTPYQGNDLVSAVIWLSRDSVLVVQTSISDVPIAVNAVRRAFEIAALAAIFMTIIVAIPLAGTIVGRLRRLRQAALHIAIDGSDRTSFPVDRARDEVGDLARSFSIMQRRLRQQEEARRAFVATASHELRTPLASLEGMLELLADDLQADQFDLDDANSLLDRARAQSKRLGRLAADLLDLSRIDAEVRLRTEAIELSELGRAVVAEFELSSVERGVTPTLRDDGTPAWAMADPGSVARILRILLDNALRVAPRGSEVSVTVSATPVPTLSVTDRGPGVAPEERSLIFDRFKRGTETGGEAGFGLGLAIGRELAQRMGGTLVLADTTGPGATFTLTLRPSQAPSPDQVARTAGV